MNRRVIVNGKLHCTKCGVDKPVESFNEREPYSNGDIRYRSHCNSCASAASIARYKKKGGHKGRRISSYKWLLENKYKLSVEDFTLMHEEQEGVCLICEEPIENRFTNTLGKKTAVDHCHNTGEVRGLLCNPCNVGIGQMKDDSYIVYKAWRYLDRWEEQ